MKIDITEHAYNRIMSDRFYNTKPKTKAQASKMIQKDIEYSTLLKICNNIEFRGHNGKIYICERMNDKIKIISVLKGNKYVI